MDASGLLKSDTCMHALKGLLSCTHFLHLRALINRFSARKCVVPAGFDAFALQESEQVLFNRKGGVATLGLEIMSNLVPGFSV